MFFGVLNKNSATDSAFGTVININFISLLRLNMIIFPKINLNIYYIN